MFRMVRHVETQLAASCSATDYRAGYSLVFSVRELKTPKLPSGRAASCQVISRIRPIWIGNEFGSHVMRGAAFFRIMQLP